MPELPEVETARRRLEKITKGMKITQVYADQDRLCFDRDSPAKIKRSLEGAQVKGSGRKGKYFWLELNRKPWPVFSFRHDRRFEV